MICWFVLVCVQFEIYLSRAIIIVWKCFWSTVIGGWPRLVVLHFGQYWSTSSDPNSPIHCHISLFRGLISFLQQILGAIVLHWFDKFIQQTKQVKKTNNFSCWLLFLLAFWYFELGIFLFDFAVFLFDSAINHSNLTVSMSKSLAKYLWNET